MAFVMPANGFAKGASTGCPLLLWRMVFVLRYVECVSRIDVGYGTAGLDTIVEG